ncbi:MAG TPA: hypothetical protein VGH94_07325 [Acidimicrobiales bacterium]|jgi:hypothetical protein
MLYGFGFDRLGVVVSDLYFVDPAPAPGQEGPEQGVRVELRLVEAGPLRGGIYSARPITIERPVWRVDLLESVDHPATLDRAHHHPFFDGWEPSPRRFVKALSDDPLRWLRTRLDDLDGVLRGARVPPDAVGATDVDDVRRAAPEIVAAVESLLKRILAGELARPPSDDPVDGARLSWL